MLLRVSQFVDASRAGLRSIKSALLQWQRQGCLELGYMGMLLTIFLPLVCLALVVFAIVWWRENRQS
jgi:hypothetical protein